MKIRIAIALMVALWATISLFGTTDRPVPRPDGSVTVSGVITNYTKGTFWVGDYVIDHKDGVFAEGQRVTLTIKESHLSPGFHHIEEVKE